MKSKVSIPVDEEKETSNEKHTKTETLNETISSDTKTNFTSLLIPFNWNGYDAFCLMILIFLATFSRFWVIQYPRHMVNLEEHQIHIINSYLNGSFYIDNEPPFASMLMAGIAYLADYNLTYSLPRTETNYSYHDMQYVAMRSTPAFFSTMAIPMLFFTVRSFGGSRYASLAAGLFGLFDFLLISLGRHIFTDGIVQFFVITSLFLLSISSHFHPLSTSFRIIIFFQSLFVGYSISSKVSAFPLYIFSMVYIIVSHKKLSFVPTLFSAFVPILVFIFSFSYQVVLMPFHSQYDVIMNDDFKIDLVHRNQPIELHHSTILPRALNLFQSMFVIRGNLKTDTESNQWYQWPFMTCNWVILWTQLQRYVCCFGNIAVWWPISVSIIICILSIIFKRSISTKVDLLCIGYVLSLLFFSIQPSFRGLCDYEIPLIFGLTFLPLFLETFLSETLNGFCLTAIIFASGFLFILWAPFIYGYENFDPKFVPYFAYSE